MKLLAFDTSGEKLSACWYEKGVCVRQAVEERSIRHSSALIPLIESISLGRNKNKAEKPDVLAVGIGPGSFTGLRVGVMTANMLGALWKIPLVGVTSLEALSRMVANGKDGCYAVYLDARKQKVYAALYERKKAKWKTLIQPKLTEEAAFLAELPSHAVRIGCGDPALSRVESVLARGVAEGALDRLKTTRGAGKTLLMPLYLHPKDCNVTIGKK